MAFTNAFPLRIAQGIFAIIILGLTAYVINDWSTFWSPSSVDFLLFTSLWTLLALIYLMVVPGRFPAAAHKFAILAFEGLTAIFWFAGFIAVAAFAAKYNIISRYGPLRAAVAACVFGAIEWLLWMATLAFAVMNLRNNGGSYGGKSNGVSGGPTTTV